MTKLLAAMLATALAIGVTGQADVWEVGDGASGNQPTEVEQVQLGELPAMRLVRGIDRRLADASVVASPGCVTLVYVPAEYDTAAPSPPPRQCAVCAVRQPECAAVDRVGVAV